MITLNDYLYSGDTVLKILQKYTRDLRKEAKFTHNEIDLMHVNFLIQITELLEHNDFLTAQSQKIREFYKYMAHEYPFLAFTFKGRIKSLIRAEEKFNGYIVEYIYDYYIKHGTYPPVSELKNKLSCFRDFIAYRIVLCMPKCHLKPGEDQETASIRYLYEIANVLPGFLEERGFTVESAYGVKKNTSPLLNEDVKMYYRDYICGSSGKGISHYISQFMITVPALSWKCSCVPRKWMTTQKLVRLIIWDMRRNSRMNVQDVMLFQKASVFISMKLMNGACVFCSWNWQIWM